MKEAVHIFLKDTRQQRYPIGMVLAWTAMLLVAGSVSLLPFQPPRNLLESLGYLFRSGIANWVLPIAWWFLVSRAFHAEAIPGDRQFWLTRPYNRGSLFGAKALFVLAYITLPLALAQIIAAMLQGFPLGPSIPGMLWSQLVVLATIVLPAAILATLTSKLAHFVLVALALFVLVAVGMPMVVEYNVGSNTVRGLVSWGALEWVRTSIAIGLAIAIGGTVLFVQFSRRRTSVARLVAVLGAVAVVAAFELTPWRTAFALQAQASGNSPGSLTATLVKPEISNLAGARRSGGLLFQIAGLPSDTPIVCEGAEASVESPIGTWTTGLRINRGTSIVSTGPEGCAVALGPLATWARDHSVNVHALLYVTVLGPERTTTLPINESRTIVPDAGVCSGFIQTDYIRTRTETLDNTRTLVTCQSAFRDPRRMILFSSQAGDELSPGRVSYSPFPADLRLLPVDDVAFFNSRPVQSVNVVTRAPVGHVRIPIDVRGITLEDYLK